MFLVTKISNVQLHIPLEIAQANITCCKKFDQKLKVRNKTVTVVYINHKVPIADRFNVAPKNCSSKPLFDTMSKIFKMILIL